MDDQAAQQDGCDAVTGDAKGQQGDHCAADGSVVCSFRSHDAVHNAGAELFRSLGAVLDSGVGHDTGSTAADAGQDADAGADGGCDEEVADLALELLPGEAQTMDLIHGGVLLHDNFGFHDLLGNAYHFRDGVPGDQDHQLLEAGLHVHAAEIVADDAVEGGDAEGGEHDAQKGSCQTLDHILAGQ